MSPEVSYREHDDHFGDMPVRAFQRSPSEYAAAELLGLLGTGMLLSERLGGSV
jgi:hypothetical protein